MAVLLRSPDETPILTKSGHRQGNARHARILVHGGFPFRAGLLLVGVAMRLGRAARMRHRAEMRRANQLGVFP